MRKTAIVSLLFCFCSQAMAMPGSIGALEGFVCLSFVAGIVVVFMVYYNWNRKKQDERTLRDIHLHQKMAQWQSEQRKAKEQRQRDNTFYVSPDGKAQKGKTDHAE